jgi:hypothetical protein
MMKHPTWKSEFVGLWRDLNSVPGSDADNSCFIENIKHETNMYLICKCESYNERCD